MRKKSILSLSVSLQPSHTWHFCLRLKKNVYWSHFYDFYVPPRPFALTQWVRPIFLKCCLQLQMLSRYTCNERRDTHPLQVCVLKTSPLCRPRCHMAYHVLTPFDLRAHPETAARLTREKTRHKVKRKMYWSNLGEERNWIISWSTSDVISLVRLSLPIQVYLGYCVNHLTFTAGRCFRYNSAKFGSRKNRRCKLVWINQNITYLFKWRSSEYETRRKSRTR
jgi:hypothetical protein